MGVLRIFLLSAIFFLSTADSSTAAVPCKASKISRADAKRLVLAVPEAMFAQKAGYHPYAQFWDPTDGDREHFYFLELDQREPQGTVLANGLLGHFAVNSTSGEVINMGDFELAYGTKLEALQRSLRRQQCIDAATLEAEAGRDLFLHSTEKQ